MDPQTIEQLHQQASTSAANAETAKVKAEAEATAAESAKTAADLSKANIAQVKADADKILEATHKARLAAEKSATEAQEKLQETIRTLEKSITASLGGAFAKKEQESRMRDWFWLACLVTSVIWLAAVGSARYEQISTLITNKANFEQFAVQAVFGLFTLSAPLWLAWLSTKRLSNTYAITEDYAYKSAIAQAYQGYRDTAKDGDEQMSLRLFATVITQLDASPVRFISPQHPGTPWQDLINQPWMQDVLKDPTIKEKFNNWVKERFSKVFEIPVKPTN
jgi:hypothetical protein